MLDADKRVGTGNRLSKHVQKHHQNVKLQSDVLAVGKATYNGHLKWGTGLSEILRSSKHVNTMWQRHFGSHCRIRIIQGIQGGEKHELSKVRPLATKKGAIQAGLPVLQRLEEILQLVETLWWRELVLMPEARPPKTTMKSWTSDRNIGVLMSIHAENQKRHQWQKGVYTCLMYNMYVCVCVCIKSYEEL